MSIRAGRVVLVLEIQLRRCKDAGGLNLQEIGVEGGEMSHTQIKKYCVIGGVIDYVEVNHQYKMPSFMHALHAFYF